MAKIKITGLPGKSKLKKYALAGQTGPGDGQTGTGNMWVNFGNTVSNMINDEQNAMKDDRLLNPGTYNPFDVKWGQEQVNPQIDITGSTSNQPLNRFATSSLDAQLYPAKSSTSVGGKGVLNTAMLTSGFTKGIQFENPKTTTTTTLRNRTAERLMKIGDTLQSAIQFGNLAATQSSNEKIKRQAKRNEVNARLTNVVTPQNMVGARGDYVTNTFDYDPGNKTVNKGMYTSNAPGIMITEYGGQINKQKKYAVGGGVIDEAIADVPLDVINIPTAKPSLPSEITSVESSSENYVLPVQNFKLSSGYGGRNAPKAGASTYHNGLDLAVPINSDVFAPMDGVVRSIYNDSKGGNQLVIEHSDGSKTGYAHLNGYKVKVGDNVAKGQIIAFSGNTGNSTGPHLHFTYRNPNGDLTDPTTIFNFGINKASKGSNDSSVTNNPLNIHYGSYAKKYNAIEGSEDLGGSGRIAIFPNFDAGIEAAKNLLFGPDYSNLTISQARNRWVSGDPNVTNPSTQSIVSSMGGDKKLNELSANEKNKLLLEFSKWENRNGYNLLKGKNFFKEGGETATSKSYNDGDVVELTEEEIKDILANGGDVEFI